MAILSSKFTQYIWQTLYWAHQQSESAFSHDMLLALAIQCQGITLNEQFQMKNFQLSDKQIEDAQNAYSRNGIIGMLFDFFKGSVVNQFVDSEVERKVICLKRGFTSMPATTMATIMQGFGYSLSDEQVRLIYASYGLAQGMKQLRDVHNWVEINRCASWLEDIFQQQTMTEKANSIKSRFSAICAYLCSHRGNRDAAIEQSALNRSLFFYYWNSFKRYGLIGLMDKGKEVFRSSKIDLNNEAKLVIDKLQHNQRKEHYYVHQLRTKGISVDRSSVAKIWKRWAIKSYQSKFISNLQRLETTTDTDESTENMCEKIAPELHFEKLADQNFMTMFMGMDEHGLYVDAPGIFVLWAYLEELGIFKVLGSMGLTENKNAKGYTWFDLMLVDIARRFYGIDTYTRSCTHEEPSLGFFSHLLTLPCNDTLLNGLGEITQKQLFTLRTWLIKRNKELSLVKGRQIAFDFHQIDFDVVLAELRKFGKGPSWKKKICYNGFRPHIAWDIETGNLIVAEFRKASARGTTTVKRFIKEFIAPQFQGIFDTVYVDSEYTGKDVWNFILDGQDGMGAHLSACLKQNRFVKKQRDLFLLQNSSSDNFWLYYDDEHVYSSKTFALCWDYEDNQKQIRQLTLTCVVKKNIKNGNLRCFATSKKESTSEMILQDYSHRWSIENGIKDLIKSYFFDKCPGTDVHHVDVHFFLVTLCRCIYRMIERDLGTLIKNPDGSVKTLATMRDILFRQGCAKIYREVDCIAIKFLQPFTLQVNTMLRNWYHTIHQRYENGLAILGGYKIRFENQPPKDEMYRNKNKKIPLSSGKNFTTKQKIS